MKAIFCDIEILKSEKEEVWIIAVPVSAVEDASVLFAALYLGRSERILFLDNKTDQRFVLCTDSLTLGNRTVFATHQWLETVWAMFVDVALFGWSDTSHIDQDVADKNGSVSVTIQVIPNS